MQVLFHADAPEAQPATNADAAHLFPVIMHKPCRHFQQIAYLAGG